ncbi:MAG: hypothetical protein QME51_00765 [Planctomycetota bacterium]|nr:hypothetical protein [Planctomycetota bacterium]
MPATIFYKGKEVCAVGKNVIPEHSVRDGRGKVLVRGWRELFKILAGKRLINFNEAIDMAKWNR